MDYRFISVSDIVDELFCFPVVHEDVWENIITISIIFSNIAFEFRKEIVLIVFECFRGIALLVIFFFSLPTLFEIHIGVF